MSSFIPFVSSSPPPLDDGQSFGWDDDDDDFGNFASAPDSGTAEKGFDDVSGTDGFDVDWSHASGDSETGSKENSPSPNEITPAGSSETGSKETSPSLNEITPTGNQEDINTKTNSESLVQKKNSVNGSDVLESAPSTPSKSDAKLPEGGDSENLSHRGGASDLNEEDDFADFAGFQDNSGSKNKPHVGSLSLIPTNPGGQETGTGNVDCPEKAAETAMEKSRDSTTTDSGIFSADISPVPKSESFSNSEGDRVTQSEDETITDLPDDSQQGSLSSALAVEPTASESELQDEVNLSSEMCLDSQGNDVSSDSPVSEGQDVQIDAFGECESVVRENDCSADIPDRDISQAAAGVQVDNNPQAVSYSSEDTHNKTDSSNVSEVETDISGKQSPLLENLSADQNDNQTKTDEEDFEEFAAFETSNSTLTKPSEEDDGFAAAETLDATPSPPVSDTDSEAENNTDSKQGSDPEQLVLRTNSVELDQEVEDEFGDFDATTTSNTNSSHIPYSQSDPETLTGETGTQDVQDGDSEDFNGQSCASESVTGEQRVEESDGVRLAEDSVSNSNEDNDSVQSASSKAADDEGKEEEDPTSNRAAESQEQDDFGDFSSKQDIKSGNGVGVECTSIGGDEKEDDFGDFSSQPPPLPQSGVGDGDDDDDDFGDFSSQTSAPQQSHAGDGDDEDFGDFSSQTSAPQQSLAGDGDDDDDFGDFSSQPSVPQQSVEVGGGDDDFGDFSSQAGAAPALEGSGWADFSAPTAPDEGEDDFGDFSDTKPSTVTNTASTSGLNAAPENQNGAKSFEQALQSCFPLPGYASPAPLQSEEEANDKLPDEESTTSTTADADKFGMLETILNHGLGFRSASQQTWQVVEHPSRKDSRVRLWNHLKDVDGSPAVVYQWNKSHTNSHLFTTLHIDTQNMLIGHKKVSVPIFATGLSLLEPIRRGERDRSLGLGGQMSKGTLPMTTQTNPALVDPGQQSGHHPTQEIPAVDFDWSSSGLTNPLTSKSLDLDFLVVQDNDASEKLSVFQSEILDAPRSNVKSSKPLEDMLKNAKPTSVRNRRDDAAASLMSDEAVRVLAGLPDLSFMNCKVLMFPIKD